MLCRLKFQIMHHIPFKIRNKQLSSISRETVNATQYGRTETLRIAGNEIHKIQNTEVKAAKKWKKNVEMLKS